MKPAPFEYHRAGRVQDVLDALAGDEGQTKVLAGGQSLVTLMNLRLARPSRLVDIGALPELERVFDDVDDVVLGTRVRHRTLETHPVVKERLPLVAYAARHIGHVAIRNRGTLGGSLAHADPAAELPLAMLLHGASIQVESARRGVRTIAAEDLFESVFTTTMEPDELLTWVTVPALRARQGWGFVEYAPRHGDYAEAGAGCLLTLDADGEVAEVRAGVMAVGDRPLLVGGADDLRGQRPGEELWRRLGVHWAASLEPETEAPDEVRHLCAEALTEVLADAHRRASEQLTKEGRHDGRAG